MRCTHCGDQITESEARFAYDNPYCQECFDEFYNYCSRCDTIIGRDYTTYDSDGEPFCNECWENQIDNDVAPDNPDVNDDDRELIIRLSRNWLNGKVDYSKFIDINERDQYLKAIKTKVGLVDNPLYVFGLMDREEYQISCSSDLFNDVKEYAMLNLPDIQITETDGENRLGISLSLRENNQTEIVNLIKHICTVKELVPAQ